MTKESKEIELLNAVRVTDSNGNEWAVRVSMDKSSYCADVRIALLTVKTPQGEFDVKSHISDNDSPAGFELCDDSVFIREVFKHLAALGYTGPVCGRAELGMQSERQVVLETGREFEQFANEKFGWTYAGGMEEWQLTEIRKSFEASFSRHSKLELRYSDGSVWAVPGYVVLNLYEHSLRAAHQGDFASYCALLQSPELKGNEDRLRAWMGTNAAALSARMSDSLRQVKPPTVDPLMTSLCRGEFEFR